MKNKKEMCFFGSKEQIRNHTELDEPIVCQEKWGYQLNNDNIIESSLKGEGGVTFGKFNEHFMVYLPYDLLNENTPTHLFVEYDIETCSCCGFEKE